MMQLNNSEAENIETIANLKKALSSIGSTGNKEL
jgi:hypothetical protein